MVVKECPVCGKTFEVSAAIADRYIVCSRECRTADTEYVTCERCGKVFRAEHRHNRHFCSEKCRRPPVFATCDTCGKPFRISPGDVGKRRYCSFRCYRTSTARSSLEIAVSDALEALGVDFQAEVQIGRFCVDFCIPDRQLVIEADGEYWHAQVKERDARRDEELKSLGWTVIRLTESEIKGSEDLPWLISNKIDSHV